MVFYTRIFVLFTIKYRRKEMVLRCGKKLSVNYRYRIFTLHQAAFYLHKVCFGGFTQTAGIGTW
jgi:hypothetical protein